MSSPKVAADYLKRKAWQLVQYIDLGTTAHIFIVEKDGERYVLKTRRDGNSDACALHAEHRVLQYLNSTPMQRYVPRVEKWLPDLEGFLMEYLRYPTQAEKEVTVWIPNLANALQTLHRMSIPSIQGISDDRPNVSGAISKRFRDLFQIVLRVDSFWDRLPGEDKSKLEHVRAYYPNYVSLFSQIEDILVHTQLALTHGDLAGDNIMLTKDGRLVFADWGAARISAALVDVASLSTYTNWSEDEIYRFYKIYLNDTPGECEETLHCLDVLSRLDRYRSCVQSLLLLNEQGEEGLDAVGRAHFGKLLIKL